MSKSGDSGFFPKKSLPIYIEPGGFFPNSSETESIVLKHSTLPKWLPEFGNAFFGRGVLKCNGVDEKKLGMGGMPNRLPLHIDLSKILKFDEKSFNRKLLHFIKRGVPGTLKRIIFLPDKASKELAIKIRKELIKIQTESSDIKISLLSSARFLKMREEEVLVNCDEHDFTLIVASTMVNGDSLVEVSQTLRRVQTNYGIGYFVGVSCCEELKALDRIKSNLRYSESGRDYQFDSLIDVWLPSNSHSSSNPWYTERRCYENEINFKSLEKRERELVSERMMKLDGANGLRDDAFLSGCYHEELSLRPNSILKKGIDVGVEFSQADVFASIYGWFHWLRCKEDMNQNPLRRRVIDPNSFFRFNDGVIQAAILRSCEFGELSYSLDPILSERITTVLDGIFDGNLKANRSEAFPEFLLAILTDRLTLCRPDIEYLVKKWEKVVSRFRKPSFEKIFLEAIDKKYCK